VCTLPCRHLLHASCAQRWLTFNDVCPLCKMKVRKAPDADGSGGANDGAVGTEPASGGSAGAEGAGAGAVRMHVRDADGGIAHADLVVSLVPNAVVTGNIGMSTWNAGGRRFATDAVVAGDVHAARAQSGAYNSAGNSHASAGVHEGDARAPQNACGAIDTSKIYSITGGRPCSLDLSRRNAHTDGRVTSEAVAVAVAAEVQTQPEHVHVNMRTHIQDSRATAATTYAMQPHMYPHALEHMSPAELHEQAAASRPRDDILESQSGDRSRRQVAAETLAMQTWYCTPGQEPPHAKSPCTCMMPSSLHESFVSLFVVDVCETTFEVKSDTHKYVDVSFTCTCIAQSFRHSLNVLHKTLLHSPPNAHMVHECSCLFLRMQIS
jgi:hypothetical protein